MAEVCSEFGMPVGMVSLSDVLVLIDGVSVLSHLLQAAA